MWPDVQAALAIEVLLKNHDGLLAAWEAANKEIVALPGRQPD
jgi:hypothetical protein